MWRMPEKMKSIRGRVAEEGFLRTRARRNEKEGKDGRRVCRTYGNRSFIA